MRINEDKIKQLSREYHKDLPIKMPNFEDNSNQKP